MGNVQEMGNVQQMARPPFNHLSKTNSAATSNVIPTGVGITIVSAVSIVVKGLKKKNKTKKNNCFNLL